MYVVSFKSLIKDTESRSSMRSSRMVDSFRRFER